MTPKVTILFLAACPDDRRLIQLDEEIREITKKIRESEYRDTLNLISAWAVRPDDLIRQLNKYKPRIVHFSGHGIEKGEIILIDEEKIHGTRVSKPINPEAMKRLFEAFKDCVRVVVLNACYSRSQAEEISKVIDCVVGMNVGISDQAAITFAASFYRALGFGRSVKEAFEQGKIAIAFMNIGEENIPELLCRPDVDPAKVFLVGKGCNWDELPPRLKNLINSGSPLIEIPLPAHVQAITSEQSDSHVYCELKMRETAASFVLCVPRTLSIGDAARYIVSQLMPHFTLQEFAWTLMSGEVMIPPYHTFATANIVSGATIYLIGKYVGPKWVQLHGPLRESVEKTVERLISRASRVCLPADVQFIEHEKVRNRRALEHYFYFHYPQYFGSYLLFEMISNSSQDICFFNQVQELLASPDEICVIALPSHFHIGNGVSEFLSGLELLTQRKEVFVICDSDEFSCRFGSRFSYWSLTIKNARVSEVLVIFGGTESDDFEVEVELALALMSRDASQSVLSLPRVRFKAQWRYRPVQRYFGQTIPSSEYKSFIQEWKHTAIILQVKTLNDTILEGRILGATTDQSKIVIGPPYERSWIDVSEIKELVVLGVEAG